MGTVRNKKSKSSGITMWHLRVEKEKISEATFAKVDAV